MAVDKNKFKELLDAVYKELQTLPDSVRDMAYAFRDFCVQQHGGSDYTEFVHKFEWKTYESWGRFGGRGVERTFVITVSSSEESCYHNDTRWVQDISVDLSENFFHSECTYRLPWHRAKA